MKVRFNSDDDLPLGKILKIYEVVILIRFVFMKKIHFALLYIWKNIWRNYLIKFILISRNIIK